MSNVIDMKNWIEANESFGYLINGRDIGIGSKEFDFEIHERKGKIYLYIDGIKHKTTRESLSRFFWAAAYYLDSDQEWIEKEYPALDKN